jgi:ATP-dependent helicase/nuclease subunit A
MAAPSSELPPSSQSRASHPSTSAWVSASAGTGKTKTLVDRILRLILSGAPPSKILCLTYTNAAALEMSERVLQLALTLKNQSPSEVASSLENLGFDSPSPSLLAIAKNLFNTLALEGEKPLIQTIHGFCQSLLSSFPLEAGISPGFTTLSDSKQKDFIQKSLKLTLAKGGPAVEESAQFLGLHMVPSTLFEAIRNFIGHTFDWQRIKNFYGGLEPYLNYLESFLGIDAPCPTYDENFLRAFEEALENYEGKTEKKTHSKLKGAFQGHNTFEGVFLNDKGESKQLVTKGFFKEYPHLNVLLCSAQEIAKSRNEITLNRLLFNKTKAFLFFAESLLEKYDTLKRGQNCLDFNDQLSMALELLKTPGLSEWVLFKLGQSIDHVLVDEAQDTSPLQWELIQTIMDTFFTSDGAHRTLFVVGDIKQSIYSFQGARPQKFLTFQDHYREMMGNLDKTWHDIEMDTSYRSSPAILNLVDRVFKQDSKGLSFGEKSKIKHLPYRKSSPGRVEIWPLVNKVEAEKEEVAPYQWPILTHLETKTTEKRRLASLIVKKVKDILNKGEILPSTGQRVRPQDILILLEKRTELMANLKKMLKSEGLPVAAKEETPLTEYLGVMDLIALGRFLLAPDDDYSLACVLKSPLVNEGQGITEEELQTLASAREGSLWQSLCQRASEKEVFRAVENELRQLLNQVDWRSPYGLYAPIIQKCRSSFIQRMGFEYDEILDAFLEVCLTHQMENIPSLQLFLSELTHAPVSPKGTVSEFKGIRILTVHGSKGLQSPLVIIGDATDYPKAHQEIFTCFEGDETNPAPLFFLRPSEKEETQKISRLKSFQKNALSEEHRRLLYVALTRAQDQLYLGGINKSALDETWYALCQKALTEMGAIETEEGGFVYEEGDFEISNVDQNLEELELDSLPRAAFKFELPQEVIKAPESESQKKGILIHKILELQGSLSPQEISERIKNIAPDIDISFDEIERLKNLKQNEELKIFFGPSSYPEFEIMTPEGLKRIDRVVFEGTEIRIIDFKSSEKVPAEASEIPPSYINQIKDYGKIMAGLYPHFQIRLFLLWTEGPKLMEISSS